MTIVSTIISYILIVLVAIFVMCLFTVLCFSDTETFQAIDECMANKIRKKNK